MFDDKTAEEIVDALIEGNIKESLKVNGVEKTLEIIEQYKLATLRIKLRNVFSILTGV